MNHFTRHVPGTQGNPLDTEGVNAKVRDLMAPVVGAQRSDAIIRRVHALEEIADMRTFIRTLLTT